MNFCKKITFCSAIQILYSIVLLKNGIQFLGCVPRIAPLYVSKKETYNKRQRDIADDTEYDIIVKGRRTANKEVKNCSWVN